MRKPLFPAASLLGLGLTLWLGTATSSFGAEAVTSSTTFEVRAHGAAGDGVTLDTAAINRAIEACAAAGGGQVRFAPGRYLSGTVRLRSHVALYLEAGATLVGATNLTEYRQPANSIAGAKRGWSQWHRALVLGEDVEDVTIAGPGTIDGNKVFDPKGEERMRGPHTIELAGGRRFTLRDISIVDSANYAVMLYSTEQVEVRNVRITGGWDGVHFRGTPERPCRQVDIINCQFYTGDDSIAGWYWENTVISGCVINSSCNGIRLIGPAKDLIVRDCLFFGPGREPHRSSHRTNMLSGIILQPGAWEAVPGALQDVFITRNSMKHVASPITVWTAPGNTADRITISELDAIGVYRSAVSVEGWGEAPMGKVALRHLDVEFAGGGKVEAGAQTVHKPGVDARPLPAWGVYARHVDRLELSDVQLRTVEPDHRPVILAEDVRQLNLDRVHRSADSGGAEPLRAINVAEITARDTDLLPSKK